MLFKIDYSIGNVEKFKTQGKPLPTYVVANGLEEAVKKAKEYEDENVTLFRCDLHMNDGHIVVAKKFKGI